ncbi:MAG: ubiquinone biosynthesis protein UbiJ [Glaciecola sp.]|jgi:ubiquinone biosynthesis protein UbiJ
MHQAQVITAAVEISINKILSLDEDSYLLLQPLISKQCEIQLHELPFPIVFNFHAKGVEVSSVVSDINADMAAQPKQSTNYDRCAISLSVFIINELKDTSNITRLIRENKLDFDGNLQIAQNMSGLFAGLNIDIEELLSTRIGDIAAHNTIQSVQSFSTLIQRNHQLAMDALSKVILDKKPIGVRPIMVENYIQEVSEVRDTAARLEARLTILENKARKKE